MNIYSAAGVNTCSEMALLKYFKSCNKDGLPNPRGSLSEEVPSRAIAQANQEMQQVLQSAKPKKKWGLL